MLRCDIHFHTNIYLLRKKTLVVTLEQFFPQYTRKYFKNSIFFRNSWREQVEPPTFFFFFFFFFLFCWRPSNLHFSPTFLRICCNVGPQVLDLAGSSQCHIKNALRTYLSHAASNSSIFVRPSFFSSKGGLTMDLGCGGK